MKTAEEILNEYGMPNTLDNRLLVEYTQKDAIIHVWCELTSTYNNIISPQFRIHNNDCPLEVCIFDANDPNYLAKQMLISLIDSGVLSVERFMNKSAEINDLIKKLNE